MSRVTVPTDKAEGRTGKGAHAEENDSLYGSFVWMCSAVCLSPIEDFE